MIDFVAYFSTADDQLGYILLDGHGSAPAQFTGGPGLAHGTYRFAGDELVLIEAVAESQSQGLGSIASATATGSVWP